MYMYITYSVGNVLVMC